MDFEQQFEEVRHRVKTKLGVASGCHDFDHTLRVLHNAELLAEKLPEADRKIVRLAALLHDFARPEEMASKGKICHTGPGGVPPLWRRRSSTTRTNLIRSAQSALGVPSSLPGENMPGFITRPKRRSLRRRTAGRIPPTASTW